MVEEPAWKAGGGACRLWVRVPRLPLRKTWGHGPRGRRQHGMLEIRVRLPVTPLEKHGPVVQRQRLLVHTQETMVRLHPGPLRLGRQPADHLGLEPGMLWVRLPPEPLEHEHALVEQPGVLACLSRRRSRVQIPSRALSMNMARYANRQSGHDHRCAAVPEPW